MASGVHPSNARATTTVRQYGRIADDHSGYGVDHTPGPRATKEPPMSVVVLLLLLALLFGGLGLFVGALKWALIIALVLLVASAVTGFSGRSRI